MSSKTARSQTKLSKSRAVPTILFFNYELYRENPFYNEWIKSDYKKIRLKPDEYLNFKKQAKLAIMVKIFFQKKHN